MSITQVLLPNPPKQPNLQMHPPMDLLLYSTHGLVMQLTPFQKTDQNSNKNNISYTINHSYNNPQEQKALPMGDASQGRALHQADNIRKEHAAYRNNRHYTEYSHRQ